MRRAVLMFLALCGLATAALTFAHGAPPAAGYWIDYDRGSDSADGLTKQTSWKHLPGDAEAQAKAAGHTPVAGDHFTLVAGSHYRGVVRFAFSGDAKAPITIAGETGGAPAVIDGSDPVLDVRACRSAAECGGAAIWQRLSLVGLATPAQTVPILFSGSGPMIEAQSPNPADLFYADEVDGFLSAEGRDLATGRIAVPASVASALDASGTRIVIWERSNKVTERPLSAASAGFVTFSPAGVDFYADRPSRLAFRGGVGQIDQPGEYALLPDRRTLVAFLPANAGAISAANGRSGIDVSGSANIVIRDLTFERFADDDKNIRSGIGVVAMRGAAKGLTIEGNTFRHFLSRLGQGAMILQQIEGLTIRRNTIMTMQYGSGMRIGRSQQVRITDNDISRIGRTGIMLMNNSDVDVISNRIHDVQGLHGNGLSAYLGNRDIRFIANTVYDAKQPATFHGNRAGLPPASNMAFLNNLFIANDDSLGALISWGGEGVQGLKISHNVILGGAKVALRVSDADRSVSIANNVIGGINARGGLPADWSVRGNSFTRLSGSALPPGNRAMPAVQVRPGAQIDLGAVCATTKQDSADRDTKFARSLGASLSCP
jgi:hypothetical protein